MIRPMFLSCVIKQLRAFSSSYKKPMDGLRGFLRSSEDDSDYESTRKEAILPQSLNLCKKLQSRSSFLCVNVASNNNIEMEEEKETIRCCRDCKTTKTPMWRSGPAGRKSLCNACGIRFRKQRRFELLGIRIIHSHGSLTSKKIINPPSSSSSSSPGDMKKRRGSLKEEEQAALCLLLLSCDSVLA